MRYVQMARAPGRVRIILSRVLGGGLAAAAVRLIVFFLGQRDRVRQMNTQFFLYFCQYLPARVYRLRVALRRKKGAYLFGAALIDTLADSNV